MERPFLSCTGVRVFKARARACGHDEPAHPGKAVLIWGGINNYHGFGRFARPVSISLPYKFYDR